MLGRKLVRPYYSIELKLTVRFQGSFSCSFSVAKARSLAKLRAKPKVGSQ
jgi:hypothetical protein